MWTVSCYLACRHLIMYRVHLALSRAACIDRQRGIVFAVRQIEAGIQYAMRPASGTYSFFQGEIMIRLIHLVALILLSSSFTASAAQSSVQDFPRKPVRLVIPFAPGGATDIIARILEPKLTRRLGQQVVVDNRPGAAGNIAVELVAQAQPDGYTLLVGNISTNSLNPLLFSKKIKVNAVRDLTGV